jgi:hypothetical protein
LIHSIFAKVLSSVFVLPKARAWLKLDSTGSMLSFFYAKSEFPR